MADAPPAPVIPRSDWRWGLAPHAIGLFLWIAFLDRVAVRTLPVGGLLPTTLGTIIGGGLAFLLLFYGPALWGQRTGKTLDDVLADTFGRAAAPWLPGLVLVAVQVALFAVAVAYGLDFTLRGLEATGLIAPGRLPPGRIAGLEVHGWLFQVTALLWTLWTALIAIWFVRVIAALMNIYPLFPAVALAGAAAWALGGLGGYLPPWIDPITARPVAEPESVALTSAAQYVFAFFAAAGFGAVDWGAATLSPRDVRLGGLVGVGLAPFVLATLALIAVAGTNGMQPPPTGLAEEVEAPGRLVQARIMRPGGGPIVDDARRAVLAAAGSNLTLGAVLQRGIGGWPGGAALLLFGLGSMAPAVYAASAFGRRLAGLGPRVHRAFWTIAGAWLALPLIAVLGRSLRPEDLFGVLGALAAPVVGAVVADLLRRRGPGPGPRPGVNPSAVVAWLAGVAVGLLPAVGMAAGVDRLTRLQPAAVFAFVTAFVLKLGLGLIGLEPRPVADAPPPPEVTAAEPEGAR